VVMGKVQKSVQKKERDPRGLKKGQTHAGSFKSEDPRRHVDGRRKKAAEAGREMAADMERAYSTPEGPDDPPGVKAARHLAHDDYPKFMAMYLKAKELAGEVEIDKPVQAVGEVAAAATPVVVEGVVGPKEESVVELAQRLLREWECEDGTHEAGGGGSSAVQGG
jgi:hypothetical protein